MLESAQSVSPAGERVRSEVASRAFFRIMTLWGVEDRQAMILLGSPSRATFYNWKRGKVPELGHDVIERISYILGVYKALQILFPDPSLSDAWVQKPNRTFAGKSALDRMLGGNVSDLLEVRRYLDFVRGDKA